ncbi:MAG: hypothetical protein K0S41_3293 [Anaerocolumna sp.]|jgi:uncharacterized membrane protein|nr:hypothetical protein [Anaerocolumna sp.]
MKIKYTKIQKAIELITILLMISMILYLVIIWDTIPDKIPGHYGINGVVDRLGNKGELISLPAFSIFLYGLLSIVTKFPSMWNLPVQVTDDNRADVAKEVRSMLLYMKLEIVIIFFYILICASNALPLGVWFLPVVIVILFGLMFYYIRKMKKYY